MTKDVIIRSHRSWLRLDLPELWEYRDLLVLLVWRDFVAKYRQTILGPAWFIIQPLTMTVIFTVIFGGVAKIPTDGVPPFLFYLCGMLAWSYFASTLNSTAHTFTANAHVFGKVYFPRLVVPFSVAISNLFAFAIQGCIFIGFWLYYRFGSEAGASMVPTWLGCFFVPLLIGVTALLALGIGLWFSSATVKYKDLGHALGLITQLWLYATPIIYPLSQVPEKWRWLIELNPMASVAEAYRFLLLGQGTVSGFGMAWTALVAVTVFLTGVMAFHKVERNFIDTV